MAERLQKRTQHTWHWRECQEQQAGLRVGEPPREPRVGQGWFDQRSGCMYLWDGAEWVCMPTD